VRKARKRRESRQSEDEALTGAAEGRILALREKCWCCNDIFRAAVRVIDEYQTLSITLWETLINNNNKSIYTHISKGQCVNKRKKRIN